jgi:uncharacterized protein YhbP (UPF0306 family)
MGGNDLALEKMTLPKMVEDFLPKLMRLGWYVNESDHILCPACSKALDEQQARFITYISNLRQETLCH